MKPEQPEPVDTEHDIVSGCRDLLKQVHTWGAEERMRFHDLFHRVELAIRTGLQSKRAEQKHFASAGQALSQLEVMLDQHLGIVEAASAKDCLHRALGAQQTVVVTKERWEPVSREDDPPITSILRIFHDARVRIEGEYAVHQRSPLPEQQSSLLTRFRRLFGGR